MKIFMTGGTGFVGSELTRGLLSQGHEVTILTRSGPDTTARAEGAVNVIQGDPTLQGDWQGRVPEHDAVINMAGAGIFTRWSRENKKRIRDSRILTTRNLVESLRGGGETDEKVLLSTSAVGYYGFQGDDELDENRPPGNDFLAEVARDWESEAMRAVEFGVRVVLCRFGIVLGRRGGALAEMLPLFRKGLGSPLGSGKQWISWIHEKDLIRIYRFLLEKRDVRGPVNCTAPHPVRNSELTRALGEAVGKPVVMPAVPGFVLRAMKGEMGEILLKGQRVLPGKLHSMGFRFQYQTIQEALGDIMREGNGSSV